MPPLFNPSSPVFNPATVVLAPLVVLALFWIVIALFQYLWNCTIPGIFKLRKIGFWEAFRLLLISAILFGGSFVRLKSGG